MSDKFAQFLQDNREKVIANAIYHPTLEQFEDGKPEPIWDEIYKQFLADEADLEKGRSFNRRGVKRLVKP